MLRTTSILVSAIIIATIALFSCKQRIENDADPSPFGASATEYKPNADNKIVLGKQIDNPYSVANMHKAYSSLASKSRLAEESSPVHTTHLYVRFLPTDWSQYDTLVADTSLELYSIPLDYEITVCGSFYHDPSIPEGKPTWQYTSVPIDFKFNPSIKHEVLSELYIPEQDSILASSRSGGRIGNKSFTDALLDEAMILTKNFDDTLQTKAKSSRTDWNPNGFVRVTDTKLGRDIPLEGVKIRCRRWVVVKVREATTNADGWYQTGSFDRPVNYSLIFETGRFDIRSGSIGQATVDGPKQKSSWNITFWADDVNRFYAHVFRGAYRYFYKDIGGLIRPNFSFKVKFAAHDKVGSVQGVNNGNWSVFGINNQIAIYRFGSNGQYESDETFSTTVHEICHSTHVLAMSLGGMGGTPPLSYDLGIIQFSQVDDAIAESWPVAVEWFITSMEYRERGIGDYGTATYENLTNRRDSQGSRLRASYPLDRAYQDWRKNTQGYINEYSPVFIDLVDEVNQSNLFNGRTIDLVSGYTIRGIESTFLKHVYGLSSLKEQCKKNKPSGVTDGQIDQLFLFY